MNLRIRLIVVAFLIVLPLHLTATDRTQTSAPFFQVHNWLKVGQTITRDSSGQLQFQSPGEGRWRNYVGMDDHYFVVYDSTGYDNILHTAVTNSTEDYTVVIVDTIVHRGVNDTIPANIQLVVQDHAGISMNSTDTLYINCRVEAGCYQIFHGNMYPTSTSKLQRDLYPEWFGAIPTISSTTNDNTTAMNNTFVLANTLGRATVWLDNGKYYGIDSLWIPGTTSVISTGLAYIFARSNAADTTIWIGGTSPGWDISYGVGDATTSVIRNIYFKGTRYGSLSEDILVYLKRPALGHVWENVQVWASANTGVAIYRPNVGPYWDNVWVDSNLGDGLLLYGGASGFEGNYVHCEQNGVTAGTYNLHIDGTDYCYFKTLHIEYSNVGTGKDTLVHLNNCTGTVVRELCVNAKDSVTIVSNPERLSVQTMHIRNWTGTPRDDKMLVGTTTSLPGYQLYKLGWGNGSGKGVSPIWRVSAGGSDDLEKMPGDTVSNWLGYYGFFVRKNNQTGLGGRYNTGSIYPPFFINYNGIVRPMLAGVPYKASDDTLSTLDFTGDTNSADSLATFINWVQTEMITNGKIAGKFFRRLFEYEQ